MASRPRGTGVGWGGGGRGPVAVLTGASRGLGRALARGLAAEGYALYVDARDETALRAVAASLPRSDHAPPTEVAVVPGDITDPAHRAALAAAAAAFGGPDLLINNAGTLGASPLPAIADYPITDLRGALEATAIAPGA